MFETEIGDENDDDEVSNDEKDDELSVESDTDRAKHKYLTKKFKGEKGEEKKSALNIKSGTPCKNTDKSRIGACGKPTKTIKLMYKHLKSHEGVGPECMMHWNWM